MIKISDLRRIKKTCFDKIAHNGINRKNLAVSIGPVNNEIYEVVMSNGNDFARLIGEGTNVAPVSISWNDFMRICDLFNNAIEIAVEGNQIKFSEGKAKFNCTTFTQSYNKGCVFNFDFDNALKINTDEMYIMKSYSIMQKYGVSGKTLVSSDGYFCGINFFEDDFGENVYLFVDKFPPGTWYFSPKQSLIVSEDRLMAYNMRLAEGNYPFEQLINFSKQALSNWFECDAKQFSESLQHCAKIDDNVLFEFGKDSLTIKAVSVGSADFATTIPAVFHSPTPRKHFKFAQKYISEFCRCVDKDGKIRILFDDSPLIHMFRAESEKLVMFGNGMRV